MLVPDTLEQWWEQRRRWALGQGQVLRRHASIWSAWKYRRMYPLYVESAFSHVWALAFVSVSAYWVVAYLCGHTPAGGSPIPNLWGMLLVSCCLLQLWCGVWMDSKYEPAILKDFPVAILYPSFYWMLLALTSFIYTTRGLLRRLDLTSLTRWRIEHRYNHGD
jgi:biofilm PGA synthesis N-glycosyltransferase PgaC